MRTTGFRLTMREIESGFPGTAGGSTFQYEALEGEALMALKELNTDKQAGCGLWLLGSLGLSSPQRHCQRLKCLLWVPGEQGVPMAQCLRWKVMMGQAFAYTPQVPRGSHFPEMRVPQHVMGCCLHSDHGFARVTSPRFRGMWTFMGQVWI